jgi:hypothetical protein
MRRQLHDLDRLIDEKRALEAELLSENFNSQNT